VNPEPLARDSIERFDIESDAGAGDAAKRHLTRGGWIAALGNVIGFYFGTRSGE
jgi:hypothetical protein